MRYLFIIVILFSSTPALAQYFDNRDELKEFKVYREYFPKSTHGRSIFPGPYYEFMAREALRNKPDNFKFNLFRENYAGTRQYDPVGNQTIERLLGYAFDLKNARSPEEKRQAQALYTDLIVQHLAHIDVVTQAYLLSRDDKGFGDSEFFAWMRRGLLASVLKTGTGETLLKAYDAFTLGEETALLAALNVKVLKTIPAHQGSIYYNMYDVQDRSDGRKYSIFIDITKPMRYLEDVKNMKSPTIVFVP